MLEWLTQNQFFVDITVITSLIVMSFFVVFEAGIFSLGSIGFVSVGAYISGVLTTKASLPMAGGIVLAGVGSALAGFLFGLVVLRLEGIYLALATFALAQAILVLIDTLSITNGVQGIIGIPTMRLTWVVLPILLVLAVVLQLVHRSHHGRAIRAIRFDPVIARGLGIRVRRYKLTALSFSGLLAGLAGALNAHEVGVISPDQYSFSLLVLTLTYAVVGGVAYWAGPLFAALILGLFHELLRGSGTKIETAAYGFVLIALMLLAPRGLGDPRLGRHLRMLRSRHRYRRTVASHDEVEEVRR